MISLYILFWVFLCLFAVIGTIRRWPKELLVIPAVIIALFLITMLETYLPYIRDTISVTARFWFRSAVLVFMTIVGYFIPNFHRVMSRQIFHRDRIDDAIFGFIIGVLNGYMIIGSIWHFLVEANYPFDWVTAPELVTALGQNTSQLIEILPPQWLQGPMLYIAAAVSIILTLVVMI